MKNVLLINPPMPDFIPNREYIIPPSLVYLAHHLRTTLTAEVAICDFNTKGAEEYLAYNCKYYDYVGITNLFSGHFPFCMEIAQKIKSINKDVKIVVGGIHPTMFYEDIIRNCDYIDYAIMGEGEFSFRELICGKKTDGICYREDGEVVTKPKTSFIEDVNIVSPPILGYDLINFNNYKIDRSSWYNPKGFDLKNTTEAPIITSRSCPNRCNFCSTSFVMGPRLRLRDPYLVVNELEWFNKEHGIEVFAMLDDNTTLVKSHVKGICQEIIKRKLNISWRTSSGIMLKTLTPDIMDLMVESGWYATLLSIESGNDYIRNKIMGKKLPRDVLLSVVNYLHDRHPHVLLRGVFIMGMAEETNESLQDTMDMVCGLPIHAATVNNIMPYIGTRVFNQALKDNLFLEKVDLKNLWKEDKMHFNSNKKFYIKPYNMELSELIDWRNKFDDTIRSRFDK
jgi:anaerobic magnesium-protoporphyrin IX monomethyl ester cyclase